MFKTLGSWLDSAVKAVLVVNVLGMLLLSVTSIVLRWFGISFLWLEPLVRHMVFATAFLGATLATSSGQHIAIEILAKALKAAGKDKTLFLITKFTSLLTIVALGWLAYSGIGFYLVEREFDKIVFFSVKSSTLVGIIPAGFSLMFFRATFSFLDFSKEANS